MKKKLPVKRIHRLLFCLLITIVWISYDHNKLTYHHNYFETERVKKST